MSTFPQPAAVAAEAVAAAERGWPVQATERRRYDNGDWGWPQIGPTIRDPADVAQRFAEGGSWHGKAATHLVTGVLVDIDPQNDGTDDGLDLPYTVTTGTPNGGTHHYYTLEPDLQTRVVDEGLASFKYRQGVDLILAGPTPLPGVVKPEGAYGWVVHPDEAAIATAPGWVTDAITKKLDERTAAKAALPEIPELAALNGLPPVVSAILSDSRDVPDRSSRFVYLIRTAVEHELTDAQVWALVNRHEPSKSKYGDRPDFWTRTATEIATHRGKLEAGAITADDLELDPGGVVFDEPADPPDLPPFSPGLRFNDSDNSTRFVDHHGERVRYVDEWGVWIVWDGTRWVIDRNKVAVYELAKSVSSALYRQAADEDPAIAKKTAAWANQSATRGRIVSMVEMARGIDGVVISHTELDTDPWLLGVRNGYMNLRTGTFHEPDPTKLMTMQTPVVYNRDAEAPRWNQALIEWFPDEPTRGYVQRVSGHCIAGDPRGDHIFGIQFGNGRNGKGTLNRAHKHVLGPYYVTPDKSLLIQKRHDEHATVKARLFRARMAVASETEQRERLNEAQVKNLTGRDPINARRMREDEWEFEPTHTLLLQTNYLPEVTGNDNGIWSRIRVIPFLATFTDRTDPNLDADLADEAAGILNWMIEGCLEWQKNGLEEPEAVIRATLEYRNSEDVLARFATDTGLQFAKGSTLIDADLKNLIGSWAAEEGVDKPTAKKINAWMKANGCREGRENYTTNSGKPSKRKIWKGASLPRPTASPEKPADTQATIEETTPPELTGPTLPVNPLEGPHVETDWSAESSPSHRGVELHETPTTARENNDLPERVPLREATDATKRDFLSSIGTTKEDAREIWNATCEDLGYPADEPLTFDELAAIRPVLDSMGVLFCPLRRTRTKPTPRGSAMTGRSPIGTQRVPDREQPPTPQRTTRATRGRSRCPTQRCSGTTEAREDGRQPRWW